MPEPVALTTTVSDQAGKTATMTEFIADNLTIAQIEEGAIAHSAQIEGLLSGIISRMEFCVGVDLSGLTGNVAAGTSDVEEVGEFIFVTGQGREVNLNLPCINDTTSPAGSDDLDQGDANIAPIIDAMINGLTTAGGVLAPCDVDENTIISVKVARERVRNSGSRG